MPESKNFLSNASSISASIIIGSLLISLSILFSQGVLGVDKGKITFNNPTKLAGVQALTDTTTPPPPESEAPTTATASVDDDPSLGNKNAPVTIIEFSDYECPFCKRHFDEVYPQLKKDYIDSGKVRLVFRDLPLPFHDPMATTEAIAASCAREQGGDEKYFSFHDKMFTQTASNGNGLARSDLDAIALETGLNINNFKACLDAEKYKDEVKKDLEDANKAGATGTPTFLIGKSTADGNITGALIVGAQPFSAFKTVIDQKLSE